MPDNGAAQGERGDGAGGADQQVFTTGEAARVCNVSQQTIIRCFDRGRLGGFRVPGSRFRRIPRAELIRFMEANGIPLQRLNAGRVRALLIGAERGAAAQTASALREDARFEVRFAATALDAGLEAGSFAPDVVVVGADAPGLDAGALRRSLGAREATQRARVVTLETITGLNGNGHGHGHGASGKRAAATPGDRLHALLETHDAGGEG